MRAIKSAFLVVYISFVVFLTGVLVKATVDPDLMVTGHDAHCIAGRPCTIILETRNRQNRDFQMRHFVYPVTNEDFVTTDFSSVHPTVFYATFNEPGDYEFLTQVRYTNTKSFVDMYFGKITVTEEK